MTTDGLPPFWSMMIWGIAATVAMATTLQAAQGCPGSACRVG